MAERAFAPAAPTAVSAAPDGSWVAVVEPAAVTIVDPITAAVHAEVGVAPDVPCEVAWAGSPSRLVVILRHPDHTILHLVDVAAAPRPLGEVRIEQPVRALATGALHALLVGDRGSIVVTAAGDRLAIGDFPSRAVPTAAGAFGPHHVIVAAAGALEEWDTHARQPRRRFRLPKPAHVRHVGGTERLLWMVSQSDPTRVEIFPLVNRGQPKLHELPEPIAAIAGHPRVELLIWIGAETGQAQLLDLEGRGRGRPIGERGQTLCAMVAGTQIGAVLAAPGEFLTIDVLDSRGVEPRRVPVAIGTGNGGLDDDGGAGPAADEDAEPMPTVAPLGDLDTPAASASGAVDRAAAAADRIASIGAGSAPVSARELSQRLAGWRATSPEPPERPTAGGRAFPAPGTTPPATAPSATARPIAPASPAPAAGRGWREALIDWTRTALSGRAPAPPRTGPLDILAERLGLDPALEPGVALLYGAHLLGHDGVAPADLARVIDRWDEALGNGALAASGVARWRRSRVRLAPPIRDALDERPPRTGELVGAPGSASSLITPCAVRVRSGRAADAATGLVAMAGGAYLVVARGADAADAILEARARGAVALLEDAAAPLRDGAARVLGPTDTVADLAVIEVD